jgi:hypothetical protein
VKVRFSDKKAKKMRFDISDFFFALSFDDKVAIKKSLSLLFLSAKVCDRMPEKEKKRTEQK